MARMPDSVRKANQRRRDKAKGLVVVCLTLPEARAQHFRSLAAQAVAQARKAPAPESPPEEPSR